MLLVSIVVYALSFVLIRTLSRYREFAADRGAAVLTKSPSSLASALVKISGAMGRIPQHDMRMAEGLNQFFIIPAGLKSGFSTCSPTTPRSRPGSSSCAASSAASKACRNLAVVSEPEIG